MADILFKIFKIRYLRYPCRVNSNIKGLLILLQGLHWQHDHVLASLGRLASPLCFRAQADCPCAEGCKAEVPQPSLVQVFTCPSATMMDEEKPEDCSLSTSQEFFWQVWLFHPDIKKLCFITAKSSEYSCVSKNRFALDLR